MIRQNPATERGSEPANGRGTYKVTKTPMRDCKGCPGSPTEHIIRDQPVDHSIISEGKQIMSERITVPIPMSDTPTKVQVYYQGELNRHGGVEAGRTEAKIKLPAPLEDCEIRVIPCDALGNALGRGYIYKDGALVPAGVEMDAPAVDPDVVEPADEASVVVEPADEASVVVERAEAEEAKEAADEEAADEEEDYLDALEEEYGDGEDEEYGDEEYGDDDEDDDDDGETLVPA